MRSIPSPACGEWRLRARKVLKYGMDLVTIAPPDTGKDYAVRKAYRGLRKALHFYRPPNSNPNS